jgi:hypothetical protein
MMLGPYDPENAGADIDLIAKKGWGNAADWDTRYAWRQVYHERMAAKSKSLIPRTCHRIAARFNLFLYGANR